MSAKWPLDGAMNAHKTPTDPMATTTAMALAPRAGQVLADVVEMYGATGEPVGSKALVESGRFALSGASIRNVMQDLEGLGLLHSPHTSAGRVPTAAGYTYYSQQLVTAQAPDAATQAVIKDQITASKSLPQLRQDVGSLLAGLTNCAALVSMPQSAQEPLETLEFIRLSGDRVLVVLVDANGEVTNRMIDVPPFISAEDLQHAARTLKPVVHGQTLNQARDAMLGALASQKAQVNQLIDQMMAVAHTWGEPVTADGAMVVAGSTNLFQYPELVRDQLQSLVKTFEEKRLLMALMEEVRQSPGLQVFVGKNVPILGREALAGDLALVASPYAGGDSGVLGTLGVIGPMRLDYKRALGVVDYTKQLLEQVLNEPKAEAKADMTNKPTL